LYPTNGCGSLPLLLRGYTENPLTVRFYILLTNLEEKFALTHAECGVTGNPSDTAMLGLLFGIQIIKKITNTASILLLNLWLIGTVPQIETNAVEYPQGQR
jgi:hypothetical protein